MRRELILDTGVAETDNQPHAVFPFPTNSSSLRNPKTRQAAQTLLLLRILGIGSRSSSSGSSSRGVRLALLRNLWLRRCSNNFLDSHNLFLDDRDVGNSRILIAQELDASRVRQVRNMNKTMQLHV